VLYELLTGELPLGRFDPPSVKARVDARIDELVLRALAKEPDRRYQHATDVKLALAKIAASPGYTPRKGLWEYKSKTTLLGWPLVHVVSGLDPVTWRPRTAKGWIAVGDGAAVGAVAVGGATAVGGIAIAGAASVGLIALAGGASIGGLFAMSGGVAASTGLAVAGGFAFGNHALAGGWGEGAHVWASNRQDEEVWPRLLGYWRYISGGFLDRL
jgi:hypothetical protein